MEKNVLIDSKTIEKKLKKIKKGFRRYNQKLVQYYGLETAQQIERQTLDEYKQLLPKTPRFQGKLNIFNFIIGENVLIVAFYKAMKKSGKKVQETIRILYEVVDEVHTAIPPALCWVAGKIFFSRFFLFFIKRSSARVSKHPAGWRISYKKGEDNSSDWYFECQECGVIKYYQAHDAEELAKYCNFVDYIQSCVFGMGMRNPQNIGQGDSICCEYMKKGRATIVPNNLSEIVDYDLRRST
ncbi:MAG: hypothetical protein BBJ57_03435 [Desulfobacterales bacterium PC51MH44]|nr:MAG: hypothetical protein BBJ57_03435 [Desulfobacterales bacterium PC51MH44]